MWSLWQIISIRLVFFWYCARIVNCKTLEHWILCLYLHWELWENADFFNLTVLRIVDRVFLARNFKKKTSLKIRILPIDNSNYKCLAVNSIIKILWKCNIFHSMQPRIRSLWFSRFCWIVVVTSSHKFVHYVITGCF